MEACMMHTWVSIYKITAIFQGRFCIESLDQVDIAEIADRKAECMWCFLKPGFDLCWPYRQLQRIFCGPDTFRTRTS